MTDHPLITDEALEAATRVYAERERLSPTGGRAWEGATDTITAFLRATEGEKPCERCGDERPCRERGQSCDCPTQRCARMMRLGGMGCPDCRGTGKVPADRLVLLSAVLAMLSDHPGVRERRPMTDRPLITDEVAEAVARAVLPDAGYADDNGVWHTGLTRRDLNEARRWCEAFVAHVEGERPCEWCSGAKLVRVRGQGEAHALKPCRDCRGTGSVPADRLVLHGDATGSVLAQVDQLIDAIMDPNDVGPYGRGWREALDALREQITLRFGERRP